MKKSIFLSLMLVTINLFANEWETSWIAALEDCSRGDYLSAECNFNLTIKQLENEHNLEHPSIYADRARIYLNLKKYENALSDINKALSSEKFNGKERIKGVSTRLIAKTHLGISEGFKDDIEFLVKNFEIQVENTDNYVIIRNMPESNGFKESLTNLFVNAGICQGKEDIKMLTSDVCIVNKSGMNFCKQLRGEALEIAGCRLWCNNNAQASIAWCVNYPTLCLVNACNSAVAEIQNNCHICCDRGFSEDVCAAPFGDILSVMQRILQNSCCCQ